MIRVINAHCQFIVDLPAINTGPLLIANNLEQFKTRWLDKLDDLAPVVCHHQYAYKQYAYRSQIIPILFLYCSLV